MNMLEHQKIILSNTSHDKMMFKKELYKSIGWLNPDELSELRRWVRRRYWNTHRDVIKEAFALVTFTENEKETIGF